MDEVRATHFVGVTLDEVRCARTGLYEMTTTGGVPVRLHDMSLEWLTHDLVSRTLVMEFRYDDPQWTPPEAWATPVAVFSFDGVEIVEQHDDPASTGHAARRAWTGVRLRLPRAKWRLRPLGLHDLLGVQSKHRLHHAPARQPG